MNVVLVTQSTSNFPLIEYLALLSQLQKFHKVRIERPPAEFDGYIYAFLGLLVSF